MFRYQILIEYAGTSFRGWQVQKKGKTIQGLVQNKISKLIKEKIISQIKLDIPVYAKDNLPKSLSLIEAVKPGSRNL